jgi:hypothetical protein
LGGVVLRLGAIVASVLGVLIVVIGSLLPWVRTGERTRSSYELAALADRLGVLPSGAATVAVRGWVLVPLLAAATVAALALGRTTIGGFLALVTGLYAVVLAWLVETSRLKTDVGGPMSIAGGIIAILGGIALVVSGVTSARQAGTE